MKSSIFALAIAPTIALAEPFSFKEFKLDATHAELMLARPGMPCSPGPSPLADMSCRLTYETIAQKNVDGLNVYLYDDRVSAIGLRIAHADFSHVVDALTERYGPPSSKDVSVYTNAMGAKVDRVQLRWNGDRSYIIAREYGGRLNSSSIDFQMHDYIEKFAKRRKAERSGTSKDL